LPGAKYFCRTHKNFTRKLQNDGKGSKFSEISCRTLQYLPRRPKKGERVKDFQKSSSRKPKKKKMRF